MEVKIRRKWDASASEIWLTTGGDHSVDVQHAVVVSRAVIFASSGDEELVFQQCMVLRRP